MYIYKFENNYTEEKCKGVKLAVFGKDISCKDYNKCLFSEQKQYRKIDVFRSHNHDINTEELDKVAYSASNDKHLIYKIRSTPWQLVIIDQLKKNYTHIKKANQKQTCNRCKKDQDESEFMNNHDILNT